MTPLAGLVEVEDSPAFTQYCGGLAAELKKRLHNGEGIKEHEVQWLAQFDLDPDKACDQLIEALEIAVITERLLR